MGPKHWQKHHTVFILPSTLELRAMKLPVPTPHFVAYTGHYHWTSGDNQLISASAPVLSPSFSIGPITTSFDLSPPAALTFLPVLHLRAYHRILHVNPRHHLHPQKKKKKKRSQKSTFDHVSGHRERKRSPEPKRMTTSSGWQASSWESQRRNWIDQGTS